MRRVPAFRWLAVIPPLLILVGAPFANRVQGLVLGLPFLLLWIVAGLLTALAPGSMILLSAATILTKNVYRELVPNTNEATVGWLARALVPAVALLAVVSGMTRVRAKEADRVMA